MLELIIFLTKLTQFVCQEMAAVNYPCVVRPNSFISSKLVIAVEKKRHHVENQCTTI